jgi:hypothetical protein
MRHQMTPIDRAAALLAALLVIVAAWHLAPPAHAQLVPLVRQKVVSTPAVSTQASASIAAAAVRHYADCVNFSAGSTTAPALTQMTVNLRDGATGAGTVLASWTVIIPASTGQNVLPFSVCGLQLPGTLNTAMTLEFSAGLTNLFESASLTFFDALPQQ